NATRWVVKLAPARELKTISASRKASAELNWRRELVSRQPTSGQKSCCSAKPFAVNSSPARAPDISRMEPRSSRELRCVPPVSNTGDWDYPTRIGSWEPAFIAEPAPARHLFVSELSTCSSWAEATPQRKQPCISLAMPQR